jgi:hypothetical protein
MATGEMDKLVSSGPSSDHAHLSETTAISIPTPTVLGRLHLVKCAGATSTGLAGSMICMRCRMLRYEFLNLLSRTTACQLSFQCSDYSHFRWEKTSDYIASNSRVPINSSNNFLNQSDKWPSGYGASFRTTDNSSQVLYLSVHAGSKERGFESHFVQHFCFKCRAV